LRNQWELICHVGVLALNEPFWEGKAMRKGTGWLSLVGFFGLVVVADAQTPRSSSAGAAFDGTYRFISSTIVSPTYMTSGGRMNRCVDDWQAGPLTIVRGQARFSTINFVLLDFEGTVGSQGELAMQSVPQPGGHGGRIEGSLNARVDNTGTARARLTARCTYDFVWRK
jgi:hypothetical protein